MLSPSPVHPAEAAQPDWGWASPVQGTPGLTSSIAHFVPQQNTFPFLWEQPCPGLAWWEGLERDGDHQGWCLASVGYFPGVLKCNQGGSRAEPSTAQFFCVLDAHLLRASWVVPVINPPCTCKAGAGLCPAAGSAQGWQPEIASLMAEICASHRAVMGCGVQPWGLLRGLSRSLWSSGTARELKESSSPGDGKSVWGH